MLTFVRGLLRGLLALIKKPAIAIGTLVIRIRALLAFRGQWKKLCSDLLNRLRSPWGDVPFVLYLIVGTIGCGALGVWIECVHLAANWPTVNLASINIALMAYFPALIGSSTMQLVYKSVEERDKAVAAFALAVLLFTFGYAVVIAVFTATNPVFALLSSIALSVFAIMIWIIANSQETTFRNVDPASPTGGDLNDGLSGNTLGFES